MSQHPIVPSWQNISDFFYQIQTLNHRKMQTAFKLIFLFCLVAMAGCKTRPTDHIKGEKFRGFMIDAPRATESLDYYFRLIDFCHKEQMNTIIFRLTDDQGSAYLFTSHPELNMREGAFTRDELKKLIDYGQKQGIEMIPEIESFGHSLYITHTKRYRFLNDSSAGNEFNALCPVSDSTLKLMKDLYTEIAAIFPSPYFHIGCDEVNWGGSELSKNALKTRSKNQIWAEYVNTLNGYVRSLGKKTIIWGDVPIYVEKNVLDLLDKDIVIMDWNYRETSKVKIDSIARDALKRGFSVIGCPGVSWCRWGTRVGEQQFENINAYADVYCHLDDPDNLGIILSNWVPKRYLQNSQWDTYTIAAEILKNKGNYHYMDAIPAFVKDHFGATFDANWEKIFKTVYEETPTFLCGEQDSLKFQAWSSENEIKEILSRNQPLQNHFGEIAKLLSACKDSVKINRGDFDDFMMTVEFMDYCYNRQNELLQFAGSKSIDLKSVESFIRKTSLADQNQLSMINLAWSKGRRCKPDRVDENYMASFNRAANYSKHLGENPAELLQLLQK
jgi:hypothetical protein